MKDSERPQICPKCKGTGGYQNLDSNLCDHCTDEHCYQDKENCDMLSTMCEDCKGTGIINCPEAKVVYVEPSYRKYIKHKFCTLCGTEISFSTKQLICYRCFKKQSLPHEKYEE